VKDVKVVAMAVNVVMAAVVAAVTGETEVLVASTSLRTGRKRRRISNK
jgi:hypothetical protein